MTKTTTPRCIATDGYDAAARQWQNDHKPFDEEAVREWQRAHGNHCTICHNRNSYTKCDSCGWWGYARPLTAVT